ncbi:hypothetical protein D3C76_950950 [compost metagenome]
MQHVVAFLVAVGVVDRFEVINIQHQKRQRLALLPGVCELAVSAFEEMMAIAALGQRVGGGQAMQFGFQLLLVGDVFGNADDDHRLPRLGLAIDEAFVAEPAHLAVGGNDSILTVFDGAFVQHFGQAAFGVVEVVRVNAVAPLIAVGQQLIG